MNENEKIHKLEEHLKSLQEEYNALELKLKQKVSSFGLDNTILNASDVAYVYFNEETKLSYVNKSFEKYFKFSFSKLEGLGYGDFTKIMVHTVDRFYVEQLLINYGKIELSKKHRIRFLNSEGEDRYFELSLKCVKKGLLLELIPHENSEDVYNELSDKNLQLLRTNEELQATLEEFQVTNEELSESNARLHDLSNNFKEQSEFYRILFETSLDPILILDNNKFIEINTSALEALKAVNKKEVFNMHPADLSPELQPDKRFSREKADEIIKKTFEKGSMRFEWMHKDFQGHEFLVEVSLTKVPFKGRVVLFTVWRSLREREVIQSKLRENEERFRTLVEVSPAGIGIHLRGTIEYLNQKGISILGGNTFDEFKGKSIYNFVHPQSLSKVVDRVTQVTKEQKQVALTEQKFLTISGKMLYVETVVQPIDYKGNKAVMIVFNDITKRKEIERKIKESELKYRLLYEDSPYGISLMKDRFIDCNQRLCEMWECEKEDIVGSTPGDFSPIKQPDGLASIMKSERFIAKAFSGKTVSFYWQHKTLKGRLIDTNIILKLVEVNDERVILASVYDITEQRKAQAALKESERRFKEMATLLPETVYEMNLKGEFTFINEPGLHRWGYLLDDYRKGISVFDVIHENYHDKIRKDFSNIHNRINKTRKDEYLAIRKNGEQFPVVIYSVVILKNDYPVGYRGVAIDISDRKNYEARIKKTTERYRAIVENINEALILHEDDGTIVEVNDYSKTLTGYSKKHLIGENVSILGNEISVASRLNKVSTDKHLEIEDVITTKDSKFVPVWISAKAITIQGKKYIQSFLTDITKRKEAEVALKRSEDKLRKITDNISDVIIQTTNDGTITYISPAVKPTLGYDVKEMLGKNAFDFLHSGDVKKAFTDVKESSPRESKLIEYRVKHQSGEFIWMESRSQTIFDDYNNPIGMVAGFRDITERIEYERKLKKAKDDAESADKLKSAFLANMSHEIRTPMNGILGFAELLRDSDLTENERSEYVEIINNRGNDLLTIINDIVDISKIEANLLKVNRSEFDVADLLEDVHVLFKGDVIRKRKEHIKVKVVIDLKPDEYGIVSDAGRLRQVLINLLSNALKYTEEGEISFGCRKVNNKIEFFVEDSGIGIPESMHTLVFERFRQVDDSETRKFGGTGLGLSICKGLIELLGGSIYVKPKSTPGALFVFEIPYEPINYISRVATNTPECTINNYTWDGKKVLIVEDDQVSFFLLKAILAKTQIQITHANNGEKAIELFNENKFDIVLMDIQLPKMNGYEVTKVIKENNPYIPVIAQTANAMADDKEKVLKGGCNDYLSKPVVGDELLMIMSKYLEK